MYLKFSLNTTLLYYFAKLKIFFTKQTTLYFFCNKKSSYSSNVYWLRHETRNLDRTS